MKLEVLISTMHQKDMSLIEKMNINTDALIINQCNKDDNQELLINNKKIRMISYNERGLSKSRNHALENSIGDICVIADDDLVYTNNYADIIVKAYEKYPDADIIAFDVPSTDHDRPTSTLKNGNVGFLHSMKISSFQITFKRKSFLNNGIKFNELFGAGSKYTCGEENILLTKCLQKGLVIKYVNEEIAIVNHNESTWYRGFDERLFITKGAMFYEISSFLSYLLIIQFAIRKWSLYKKNVSFLIAYKYMLDGLNEYKNIKWKA